MKIRLQASGFGLLVVALCLLPSLAAAQALPDFSGKWTTEPAENAGTGWGQAITIAQDAKQLTIEYVFFSRYDGQPPVTLKFALDGSESRNTVMLGRGTQVRMSRASWSGQVLTIKTTETISDLSLGKPFTTETTHTLRLESPTSLIVEVTRGGALGGAATTTRTVYKKG